MKPSDPQTELYDQQTPPHLQGNQSGLVPTQIRRKSLQVNWFPIWLWLWITILITGGVGLTGWQYFFSKTRFSVPTVVTTAPLQVETFIAQATQIEESTEFIGSLEPSRSQIIQPHTPGVITKVLVNLGDRISAGTPILEVDPKSINLGAISRNFPSSLTVRDHQLSSPKLDIININFDNQLARLSVLEAERASRQADVRFYQGELNKYKNLVSQGAVSRQTREDYVNKLKIAQTDLAKVESRINVKQQNPLQSQAKLQKPYNIKAPVNGKIISLSARLGDIVDSSSQLATIVQTQPLELQLYIPATRLSQIHKGMSIKILNDQGKTIGTSKVVAIATRGKNSSDSVLVTAVYHNPPEELEVPNFTRTRIIWKTNPGVKIPRQAVTKIGKEFFVYVAETQTQTQTVIARQRKIKLASIQGNYYQVQEGLQPGEKVIITNLARIRDNHPILIKDI